eukprot:350668-Chlamydomonas_euryale.AAC.2
MPLLRPAHHPHAPPPPASLHTHLRRPVRRQQQQRHVAERSLHNCGQQVCDGCAARGHDGGGPATRASMPQRPEPKRALVDAHVEPCAWMQRDGVRERGGAGACGVWGVPCVNAHTHVNAHFEVYVNGSFCEPVVRVCCGTGWCRAGMFGRASMRTGA